MDLSTPPPKKQRLEETPPHNGADAAVVRLQRSAFLSSLSRPVSPPTRSPGLQTSERHLAASASTTSEQHGLHKPSLAPLVALENVVDSLETPSHHVSHRTRQLVSSPFQLSRIQGLSAKDNVDTVTIKDLLGDVMIREAWIFNFLFDIDWVMQQFDADVRSLVNVKIVHGSWKRESENKIRIDEACRRHPNVKAITAYMPDPFGTHHTKMIVLLRHDELAQVIIHTANMISQDWTNMTQAVWRSPLLPLLPAGSSKHQKSILPSIGCGMRFKHDFLAYLEAYEKPRTGPLVAELSKYDFSAVRGALVGSVPSKIKPESAGSDEALWGWLSLRRVLKALSHRQPSSIKSNHEESTVSSPVPHIVCQISSIAALPPRWLDIFFATLATNPTSHTSSTPSRKKPSYSVIFPTQREVQQSLDGYASGGSIHTRIQSASQSKQVENLRPYLCYWGSPTSISAKDAGRQKAAPHIKTYIRFSSFPSSTNSTPSIDWALLTSANLSTQAWGGVPSGPGKDVKIQSFELGVLVWPELYAEEDASDQNRAQYTDVSMVPVFGQDTPDLPPVQNSPSGEPASSQDHSMIVGLRMPYDLPLQPYSAHEMPWCATMAYTEPDRFGATWPRA